MINSNQIEAALGLTGVELFNDGSGGVWITANETVTAEMQAKVRRYWARNDIDLDDATAYQFRAALVAEGWVTITTPNNPDADLNAWANAQIAANIADANNRVRARLAWAHSALFVFGSPLVNALATGKTAQEKRQLFRTADDF